MSPLVVFYDIGLLVVVAVIVLAVTLGRRANHREGFSSARERTLEAQHRRARMDAGGVDRAERGGVQGGVHSGPVREPASQTAGKIGSVLIAYIDESYDQDTYFIGAAVANEAAWELVADGYDTVRQRTALLRCPTVLSSMAMSSWARKAVGATCEGCTERLPASTPRPSRQVLTQAFGTSSAVWTLVA